MEEVGDEMKVLSSRRSGYSILEFFLCIAAVGLMAVFFFPRGAVRPPNPSTPCQSNLKQIGTAILQYTQDYDGRMPSLALSAYGVNEPTTYGWADAIYSYVKSTYLYQCPSQDTDVQYNWQPTSAGFTDYYLNTRASQRSMKYFEAPSRTILCGEGNDGTDLTDARYNRSTVPRRWRSNENSPLYRHRGYANYLFVDGHVKALEHDRIKDTLGVQGFSFATRNTPQ
jgi:prepilin-type processing-associated H-X9-DG protein